MARSFEPDELASRTFLITMASVGSFIAVVFIFIL